MQPVFIFIGGAEGSGTTFLSRLLAAPASCVSLGGAYVKIPDEPNSRRLVEAFNAANKRAWDRTLDLVQHEAAIAEWRATMSAILADPTFAGKSHFIFKRSFPFGLPHGQYFPDLWDVIAFMAEVRPVIIYREPVDATFSTFRRGFDTDLRRLAYSCAEQLTRLSAQIEAIGAECFHLISYAALCRQPEPVITAAAQFCGISADAVYAAALAEGIDQTASGRAAAGLTPDQANWLTQFFALRRRQWKLLEGLDHHSRASAVIPAEPDRTTRSRRRGN